MKGVEELRERTLPPAGSLEYLIDRLLDLATMPAALIYLYACKADDVEEERPGPRLVRDEVNEGQAMWGVDDYADAG